MTRSGFSTPTRSLLGRTAELANGYLASLDDRPVGRPIDLAALRAALGGPLPERGEDPLAVVEHLAKGANGGLVASAGPRFFGFVVGGSSAEAILRCARAAAAGRH